MVDVVKLKGVMNLTIVVPGKLVWHVKCMSPAIDREQHIIAGLLLQEAGQLRPCM